MTRQNFDTREYARFRIKERHHADNVRSYILEGREWGFWSHWYHLGLFDSINDAIKEMRDVYVQYPHEAGNYYFDRYGKHEPDDTP